MPISNSRLLLRCLPFLSSVLRWSLPPEHLRRISESFQNRVSRQDPVNHSLPPKSTSTSTFFRVPHLTANQSLSRLSDNLDSPRHIIASPERSQKRQICTYIASLRTSPIWEEERYVHSVLGLDWLFFHRQSMPVAFLHSLVSHKSLLNLEIDILRQRVRLKLTITW